MIILKTNTGKEIICNAVIRASLFDTLHIHTNSITPAEAYAIFGNPEETKLLTKIETDDSDSDKEPEITIYRGFSDFYSIQKSPFYRNINSYLIWLNRPIQDDPGEGYSEEEIQEGRDAITILDILIGQEF